MPGRAFSRTAATVAAGFLMLVGGAGAALAAGGQLDPSWGGTGFVTTPIGVFSTAFGVIARGNGVVAVGGATDQDEADFAIAAYNRDGSLDQTFGTGGIVTTNFEGFDYATAVTFQGDKLVVVGFTSPDGLVFDFAVARYNKDGSLDQSFGAGGKVVTDFGGSDEGADAVTVKGNKIVAAGGTSAGGGGENFGLARYNKDGSLDQSFGNGGLVTTDFDGGFDAANGLQVMENRIVAVGYANFRANSNFALARYLDNGSLDPSFGTGGKVETDFNGGEDAGHAVDIRGGTIVAVGSAETSPLNQDFAVAEYDKQGALDPRFGGDGKATLDMGGDDEADGGAIQYNGRVVAAGGTPDGQFGTSFAVARFTSDGSPDPSFGGGTGFVTTQIGLDSDAYGMALGPDNRIVAAGYSNNDFAVARYLAN